MNTYEIRKILNETFGHVTESRPRAQPSRHVSNALLSRAAKALISDMYSNFGQGVFRYVEHEIDEDVTEEDMHVNNNKWKRAIKDWAEAKIFDCYATIERHFVDGSINIWREITLDDNNEPDAFSTGKHPGVYWSYEKNAAEAHWGGEIMGKGTNKWLFHAILPVKYIEWIPTLVKNANPQSEEEKEIRVLPVKFEYTIEKR